MIEENTCRGKPELDNVSARWPVQTQVLLTGITSW